MKILNGDESKKFIIESLETIISPVVSTLGPKGTSVLLSNNGNPILTKDGLTVAKVLGRAYETNPVISNYIANLTAMEEEAGDGTTTMSLLLASMYRTYIDTYIELEKQVSVTQIVELLEGYKEEILGILENIAVELNSERARNFIMTSLNESYAEDNLTDLISAHYKEICTVGDLKFIKGNQYKYEFIPGFMLSKELCTVRFNSLPKDSIGLTVKILDRFNISAVESNTLLVVTKDLSGMDMRLLEANSPKNLVVLHFPLAFSESFKAIIQYDEFSKTGYLNNVLFTDLGTFFKVEQDFIEEIKTITETEYYHHIITLPIIDELLFKESMLRAEDCVRALQKLKGNKVVEGAGKTYTKVIEVLKQKWNSNSRVFNILEVALNTPNKILSTNSTSFIPYDSFSTSRAAFLYAFESLKSLILTDYIVLDYETN